MLAFLSIFIVFLYYRRIEAKEQDKNLTILVVNLEENLFLLEG